MDGVTVITGPRSGAGHLFALLNNIEGVAPLDNLFEPGGQSAGVKIDVAELEAHRAGKSLLALKLTSAVPADVAEEQILSRMGMRAIFVVRRQIDAYVSLAKATALSAWRDTDLTLVKVKLDPERFSRWLDEQDAWYAHWKQWLEKRAYPLPIMRYETHINVPVEAALRRFQSTVGQVGISVKVPLSFPHAGLRKQDRERVIAFKVKNWPEFSRAISQMGIEKRAFGYPL